MLTLSPAVRIYLASGSTDLRRSIDGLSAVVREHFGLDPLSGHLFLFRNRRGDRLKILLWDQSGFWVLYNQRSSHYTSSNSIRVSRVCRRCVDGGHTVDEPVPSTAVLAGRIRPGILVEPRVAIGSMRANDAVLSPSGDGVFMDPKTRRHFRLREHASIPKSIVPRAEPVSMHEIRDPEGGKARVVPTRTRRTTRTQVSRIQAVRDLLVDVVVEELIDERHDLRRCRDLLRGGPGVPRLERHDLATLEAHVKLGGAVFCKLEEGRILDDVREQSLAFAVRRGRVRPEAVEVGRHRDEPFANRVIEDDLIVVSRTLSFVSCLGQRPEFLIPVGLKCVGHEAITWIDQHVPALRQRGVDVRALHGSTA